MSPAALGTARLSAALPDFGSEVKRRALPVAAPVLAMVPMSGPSEAEIEARIAAAVAEAEAALAARLTREHAAALEALKFAHDGELANANDEQGARLGEALAQKFSALEVLVADLATSTAASILANLVSDDIARRSIEALAASIRGAIGDSDAIKVTVRGPQSMFEALEKALGQRAEQLVFAESAGADLAIAIDETQFQTRLAEWQETVAGIVAGDAR